MSKTRFVYWAILFFFGFQLAGCVHYTQNPPPADPYYHGSRPERDPLGIYQGAQ